MTVDTFLFNAGWLFFAAWIAVIVGVTVAAFGRDLLPWNADAAPPKNPAAVIECNPPNPPSVRSESRTLHQGF
jgi:hypothetical protein